MKPKWLIYGCIFFLFAVVGCKKQSTPPSNNVPVANAGLDQTITLPTNSVTLTGAGADADGQVVAYLWSQIAGPSATVIVNPGSTNTLVNGFVQGIYFFQLMVTDNKGATGVDTAKVTVNQAPETTLTLQPANNPNDYKLELLNGVNNSHNGAPDIVLAAWTNGGNPASVRSLLKFDLSAIPQSATIISANLYLYSYPPPLLNGNGTEANFGTNNSYTVERAVTDWSPASITWFNQPAGASQGQLIVPHTASSFLDINLDVTTIVGAMVNNNTNFGFLMKLLNETIYTSRIFASSNYSDASKRPKLVVVYR